jgi:hypothetical protein
MQVGNEVSKDKSETDQFRGTKCKNKKISFKYLVFAKAHSKIKQKRPIVKHEPKFTARAINTSWMNGSHTIR